LQNACSTCETDNASRYLMQLCKHFAHKVPVTYDEHTGLCAFACGTAELTADMGTLRIRVSSEDADGLAQTKDVIESHLLRFAFRENLSRLDWISENSMRA
jgi:hypothetical protein